jgi:deoxycytidylate deaminase
LSYGFNRRLSEWEISAIYDAIFSARDMDLTGTAIFSTYFPTLDDMKLIVATGISSIYYFGEITDMDAVRLINNLNEKSMSLEIIKLQ